MSPSASSTVAYCEMAYSTALVEMGCGVEPCERETGPPPSGPCPSQIAELSVTASDHGAAMPRWMKMLGFGTSGKSAVPELSGYMTDVDCEPKVHNSVPTRAMARILSAALSRWKMSSASQLEPSSGAE